MADDDLGGLREEINDIDDALLILLSLHYNGTTENVKALLETLKKMRIRVSLRVEKVKRATGQEIINQQREDEELARMLAMSENIEPSIAKGTVREFFLEQFRESREAQQRQRAAASD